MVFVVLITRRVMVFVVLITPRVILPRCTNHAPHDVPLVVITLRVMVFSRLRR
jgi:hypothetical protein